MRCWSSWVASNDNASWWLVTLFIAAYGEKHLVSVYYTVLLVLLFLYDGLLQIFVHSICSIFYAYM